MENKKELKFCSKNNKIYFEDEYVLENLSDATTEKTLRDEWKSFPDVTIGFDSTALTLEHKLRVSELIGEFCTVMINRASKHDNSKLGIMEKPVFDSETPKLKSLTYGSKEYEESLKSLGKALIHHYKNNSHHPEHAFSKEEWIDIEGYEGIYQISNIGRLKRLQTIVKRLNQGDFISKEKIRKPHVTPKGYARIQLTKNGVAKNLFIHVLVAKHFLNYVEGKQVNHKDGNKLNNHVENLEYVTPSQNLQHAYDNNLKKGVIKYVVHCKELGVTTFGTVKMEAELKKRGYENASSSAIWRCVNSENEKHTHLDLHFESWNINEYKTLQSGINNMTLFDVVEMLFDWKAATERHNDGDINVSIEKNQKRFLISDQLTQIFKNTAKILKW